MVTLLALNSSTFSFLNSVCRFDNHVLFCSAIEKWNEARKSEKSVDEITQQTLLDLIEYERTAIALVGVRGQQHAVSAPSVSSASKADTT